MSGNNHQLLVTIGATLSSGFNSIISGSTSKLKQIGSVIKDLEKQSLVSSSAITYLKKQYNSLLGTMNRQQEILSRRENYRSQIMDIIALGASLAIPINSAMKFESAMADVKKVVDFSTADGLQKMSNSLKELSRTIPLSVEGLAQISAAGGQLGVKENDLITFTSNVAKMSTAFDMLPEEAGKSMATLSNVFDIPITKLTSLGDAINHISNNSAASAKSIVPALAKAGGAARQFGLSAENTTALVGTLIAMGRAPEEAGTAISAILQRLQLADKLGSKAASAFRKIGISAKVFGRMISEDAQRALTKFFNAVEKIQGQDRVGVLVDIFGKNYSSTVATLVGSLEKYREQLKLISDPNFYLGSMEKEFTTRTATTENSLQLLKNNISELSIVLGESLMPTVNSLFRKVGDVLKIITSWVVANPELTRSITHVIGGLITAKLATFTLGYAMTFLFGGLNKVVMIFKGLRLGISLIGVAFKMSLGWIGMFATAGWLIYENWKSIQEFLSEIWEPIKPYWNSFKGIMNELGVTDFILPKWILVKEFFSDIWSEAIQSWNEFVAKLQDYEIINAIKQKWETLKNFFRGIFDYLSPIIDKISSPFLLLMEGTKSISSKIGNFFKSKSSERSSRLKTSELEGLKTDVTKNQNNNFTINIQAGKNDNPESIANKVSQRVADYSRTFLYDEPATAL